jgi:hypothetical protein
MKARPDARPRVDHVRPAPMGGPAVPLRRDRRFKFPVRRGRLARSSLWRQGASRRHPRSALHDRGRQGVAARGLKRGPAALICVSNSAWAAARFVWSRATGVNLLMSEPRFGDPQNAEIETGILTIGGGIPAIEAKRWAGDGVATSYQAKAKCCAARHISDAPEGGLWLHARQGSAQGESHSRERSSAVSRRGAYATSKRVSPASTIARTARGSTTSIPNASPVRASILTPGSSP